MAQTNAPATAGVAAAAPGQAAAAPAHGPGYTAMLAEFEAPAVHSEAVRRLLEDAAVTGSVHHADGMHLNSAGIAAAVPFVVAGAEAAGVTLVTSDSTLCAVDGQVWDQPGNVVRAALPAGSELLIWPKWGASFRSGGFANGIWNAWSGNARSTIQVLVAGNDLYAGADAGVVGREMRRVRADWLSYGVRILFVDVVPNQYMQH